MRIGHDCTTTGPQLRWVRVNDKSEVPGSTELPEPLPEPEPSYEGVP